MKRYSAQYIITNNGEVLKRGIVTTADDGTILSVEDTGGVLREDHSIEFHNGILIPGFVNCHCHLELSHMKGAIGTGTGLGNFISDVRNTRQEPEERILSESIKADKELYAAGVNLCADICNTPSTFQLKKESRIRYINLLEVFGIDPEKAGKRMEEISAVSEIAEEAGMKWFFVPHAVYSMSLSLLRILKDKSEKNKVTSIHFMETAGEKDFLEKKTGSLADSYKKLGLISFANETANSHWEAVLNEITPSGNLILVHNTFADSETIEKVSKRKHLYWCLCPNSNLYIENQAAPVELLKEAGCEIVTGTDSLASNHKLDILEELKTLQLQNPSLRIPEMVKWATLNGAKALGEEAEFGSIAAGKKPGLLLIENADLQNMKLQKESYIKRLI
jgi:cytosine/adenosine deaminase-related metal-dependent hydrolase